MPLLQVDLYIGCPKTTVATIVFLLYATELPNKVLDWIVWEEWIWQLFYIVTFNITRIPQNVKWSFLKGRFPFFSAEILIDSDWFSNIKCKKFEPSTIRESCNPNPGNFASKIIHLDLYCSFDNRKYEAASHTIEKKIY